MCDFITLTLPPRVPSDVAQRLPVGLYVEPCANPSLARHVGERQTLLLTCGMCACGLFVEAGGGHASRARDEILAARKKYSKRGWSAAKIERAITGLHTSLDRAPSFVGLRPDVRSLVADIADEVGEVGVLVHTYGGSVVDEVLSPTQGAVSTPEQLRTGSVEITRDVLAWIRRPRGDARR